MEKKFKRIFFCLTVISLLLASESLPAFASSSCDGGCPSCTYSSGCPERCPGWLNGFFVTADYLYWKPEEDQLQYAVEFELSPSFPTPPLHK